MAPDVLEVHLQVKETIEYEDGWDIEQLERSLVSAACLSPESS